jgi:hypothetical protein
LLCHIFWKTCIFFAASKPALSSTKKTCLRWKNSCLNSSSAFKGKMHQQSASVTATFLVATLMFLGETTSAQGCVGGDLLNAGEDNYSPTSFLPQSSSLGTGSLPSLFLGSSVCSPLVGHFSVDMDVRSETIPCTVYKPDVMNAALTSGSTLSFSNSYGCSFSVAVTQPYVSGVTFNVGSKCHHGGWAGTCYFGYLWVDLHYGTAPLVYGSSFPITVNVYGENTKSDFLTILLICIFSIPIGSVLACGFIYCLCQGLARRKAQNRGQLQYLQGAMVVQSLPQEGLPRMPQ